jgi:hypothetical protein
MVARALQVTWRHKEPKTQEGSALMTTPVSWLEQQICRSVAGALLARTEFFELLEDATISPARLARARANWRQQTEQVQTLRGLMA